ncbi:hypothetical protein LTR64_006200 [Lithohypha guttulata]|uniref:uncharacterized protein n=1 Tax=Lithohypha guttulata TaxID=1690604 RepID=UPI002DE02132|nr:hypothetical protein LTR51_002002 [Lithohypha guttulata]
MEGVLIDNTLSVEMQQKVLTMPAMFGRRSTAPRPLSEATVIFDTDDEDDFDTSSPASLEYDSHSTTSSLDALPTPPDTAGLGGFTFHFDPVPVKGPVGPHLFRTASAHSSHEVLELSPVPITKPEARRVSSLPAAVARLDETQVRNWSPQQVANWMSEAGFESSVVEKFLIHDIYGSVLLDLQFEDLKEIDIESFGKRRRVMSSIQHLRNSSMVHPEDQLPLTASPIKSSKSLSRTTRADETYVVAQKRSRSRHGRHMRDIITPAESISIVAIEQLLPEPHVCSKGEDCAKRQKQQRKIQKIKQDFAEEVEQLDAKSIVAPSTVGPSVAASSDVLGPVALPITPENLNNVQPRDPQDHVRQYLQFQGTRGPKDLSPPSAPSAIFAAKSSNLRQELPRLWIPSVVQVSDSPDRTPISALRNPTQVQSDLKAALRKDPFHYGGVASPVDVYRVATPMSVTDLPVTALPIDPCQREVSQSVPPEMRYGVPLENTILEPIRRCSSTQPSRRRQPSFLPAIDPVIETPPITSEIDLANHEGWMRKRKTTRMLRHEWQDNYFQLNGNKLDMYNSDVNHTVLDTIDVDEYEVHAYTITSNSKLKSAFAKVSGTATKEPSFAFTLVPEDNKDKKLFDKSGNHHFAVTSSKDRVEWMRKLMLAKALKKNNVTAI